MYLVPEIADFPHFFVLDEKGKLIHSQDTTNLQKGEKYNREKMLQFIKKWSTDIDG